MGAFSPGMFNPAALMMMGGKGMFPGMGQAGAPGMGGMFPPMWNFPGYSGSSGGCGGGCGGGGRGGGGGGGGCGDSGKGRRRVFSRSRSRARSGSRGDHDDRGKSTDYLSLPRNIMGRVIGKAGSTINKIRDESGARIDAEDRSDDQCEFRIQGNPEQVAKAKRLIEEVAGRATGPGARGGAIDDLTSADGPIETVEFPIAVMGGIIGAKGIKIQEVRTKSGAKVQVERSGEVCKVQIAGEPDQIEAAKDMVRKLAEEEAAANAAADAPDAVTDSMEFPVASTGRIIGSRGASIAEVRAQTGARISVEKEDDRCRVQIGGTDDQIRRAREMITALAEGGDDVGNITRGRGGSEDVMEVPLALVGRVIGKGGETVQRLQSESGARIDVNTKSGDPCRVTLTGSRDAVQRARMLVRDVIEKWSGQGAGGGDAWSGGGAVGAWPPMGYGAWPPPPAADWQGQWPGVPPAGDGGGTWGYAGGSDGALALTTKDIDLDEL